MADIQARYTQALLTARNRYLRDVEPDIVDALIIEYVMMIDSISRRVGSGDITAERAESLVQSIFEELQTFTNRFGVSYDKLLAEAIDAGVEGHIRGLDAVNGPFNEQAFAAIPAKVLETMHIRRRLGQASTFKTLIKRHVVHLAPQLDELIREGVGSGFSAKRLQRDIAYMLSGNDGRLMGILKQVNGSVHRAIREGLVTSPQEMKRLKSLFYDARRIAVTEINTAYFEADRLSAHESDVVGFVKWQVSGRHYGLKSSPDICTYYHEADHGHGKGIFIPDQAPPRPHPFCACMLIPQVRPVDEWDDPKPQIVKPGRVNQKEMKRVLERHAKAVEATGGTPRNLTKKFVKRQTALANDGMQGAYQVAKTGKLRKKPERSPVKRKPANVFPKPQPVGVGPPSLPPPPEKPKAKKQKPEPIKASLKAKVTKGNPFLNKDGSWKKGADVVQEMIEFQKRNVKALLQAQGEQAEAIKKYNEQLDDQSDKDLVKKLKKEAQQKQESLDKAIETLGKEDTLVSEWLKFGNPSKVKAKFVDPDDNASSFVGELTREEKDLIEANVKLFAEFIGEGLIDNEEIEFMDHRADRGYFDIRTRKIAVSGNKHRLPFTVLHESSHVLEYNNKEYFKKVVAYLKKRTKGKRIRTIPGYKREKGYNMDSDSSVNPYTWKSYQRAGFHFATELTSMTIENMLKNPIKWAKDDPDLFAFIYDLLREFK